MDFAIDLKVALSVMLLFLGGGALWAWARPVQAQPLAAQRLLLSVFAHAPVAVLWLSSDGEVLMANFATARVGGPCTRLEQRSRRTQWLLPQSSHVQHAYVVCDVRSIRSTAMRWQARECRRVQTPCASSRIGLFRFYVLMIVDAHEAQR
jgi:hypothetical protein